MSEQCKISIVCENTVAGTIGFIGEHGWSVYIERGDNRIIFDTGQGIGFSNNTRLLNIDLREVQTVILSHGHYDHTLGLQDLFKEEGKKTLYCHPDCFIPKFSLRGKTPRYIGIPYTEKELKKMGADIHFITEFTEIMPGIHITGSIPRVTDFESVDSMLKVKGPDDEWETDTLWDDMSVVIETEKGLVVILGCAHSGIINTLKHVAKQMPGLPIDTVIGGTHLGFADKNQFDKTVDALKAFNIKHLGVSHCTGQINAAKLHHLFKDSFFFASVGTSISF